jgi:hypothetical protein
MLGTTCKKGPVVNKYFMNVHLGYIYSMEIRIIDMSYHDIDK